MMAADTVVSPFQIDEKEYESLIECQLATAAALSGREPSEPLLAARRLYIRSAIAKSVALKNVPLQMAFLGAEDLVKAAATLPDKQAMGWENKIASLSSAHRDTFADAAEKRTIDMLWKEVFPEASNEIILPFLNDACPVEDDIINAIAAWNRRTKRTFNGASQPARTDISQQLIRFDPNDPSKLQTYTPKIENGLPVWNIETNWKPGPRFGKFLQDQHEWRLYEIYHDKTNARKDRLSANGDPLNRHTPTLDELAHPEPLDADAFAPESLRVVLSRDPQKIGEMSTGQRWFSCMATNGCHYHHVAKDIEEGTLIAFVSHKNDPEARYPLMRILLKPYRNEANDTILIPAKIYGGEGEGNARTRAALVKTLNHFLATTVNAGKVGQFRLAESLYDDGQPVLIQIQERWSSTNLIEAMLKFQQGALEEWLTEFRANRAVLKLGKQEAHRPNEKTPAENIDLIRKKIRHLFNTRDTQVGLPRMFYREMLKSALGSLPQPKEILAALAHENILAQRQAAFDSLKAGDLEAWKTITRGWSPENCCQTALAFIAANESSEPHVLYAAAAAYVNDIEACLMNRRLRTNTSRRYSREVKKLTLETSWNSVSRASLSRCLEDMTALADMWKDETVRMAYAALRDRYPDDEGMETADSLAHARPFRDPHAVKRPQRTPKAPTI